MSIAYKCDRCGKLYSEKPQNYNYKPMILTCSTNGNRHDHSADLCNECFDSFMEWWDKPTINPLKLSKDSPYICTVTGNEYICMGGCGFKSGTQCMDDSEDTPCQFRALPPDVEEPGADPPETVDCIKQGR
ncbi:MAG: hypothetical protein J6U54_07640 [Clostridiales bacterium]|nr:hypothetical protein [Clostridiales bacterium]